MDSIDPETKVVRVNPGVCRFNARITTCQEDGLIVCQIESDCPCVRELADELDPMDPFEALKMPYESNLIFQKAGNVLKHCTCPIPTAILKCMEATAGLALPRDVIIEFE